VEVETLKKDFDLRVKWEHFFLRPDTPPEGSPLPAYIRDRMADPNNPLKRRAQAKGLTMVQREIIPSTHRAHEAAAFARAKGQEDAMQAALLRRYWVTGQDLWAMDTLTAAAVDAGLEPEELREAIETRQYADEVDAAVESSRQLGVSAVPTFLFENQFVIQGAQEQPAFREVMRRLGRAPRGG
jgi:predicted DsbA family dithiol-disulfide isomerase